MVGRMLQASKGRRGKQQQEQNSPNHIQRLFLSSECKMPLCKIFQNTSKRLTPVLRSRRCRDHKESAEAVSFTFRGGEVVNYRVRNLIHVIHATYDKAFSTNKASWLTSLSSKAPGSLCAGTSRPPPRSWTASAWTPSPSPEWRTCRTKLGMG